MFSERRITRRIFLKKPAKPRCLGRFGVNVTGTRINCTIRREMGRDIDGACGQLRKRYSEEHQKE